MQVIDQKVMAAITAAVSAYLADEWSALEAAKALEAIPVGAGHIEFMCPRCGYMKRIALS